MKLRLLDIGGEGRHPMAWNLNASRCRTLGKRRGEPIPRLIPGRADRIPLPDQSVEEILVERTPLTRAALEEITRVIAPGGQITLRHAWQPRFDVHALARQVLPGMVEQSRRSLYGCMLQETRFSNMGALRPKFGSVTQLS